MNYKNKGNEITAVISLGELMECWNFSYDTRPPCKKKKVCASEIYHWNQVGGKRVGSDWLYAAHKLLKNIYLQTGKL